MSSPSKPLLIGDVAAMAERTGTKWSHFGDEVIPAWIAEMDVQLHPAVAEALHAAIDGANVGYPEDSLQLDVLTAFVDRMEASFGWRPTLHDSGELTLPSNALVLSNVIQAACLGVATLTEPGDGVVVLTPSYPPFLEQIPLLSRTLVTSQLIRGEQRYEIDFDELERCCASATALLMVNPHNPTGRVFSRDELQRIDQITRQHGVVVISDEIHADFVWASRHVPYASIAADNCVTVTSPTKSFSLAGARCAVIHTDSERLAARLAGVPRVLLGEVSNLGAIAATVAWREGVEWQSALHSELLERRAQVADALAGLDGVEYLSPEATYLAWIRLIDCPVEDPAQWLTENVSLALGHGPDFGPAGVGHVRLNFATGEELLTEILKRFAKGVEQITR